MHLCVLCAALPALQRDLHAMHPCHCRPQFSTVSGGISNINARLAPAAKFGLDPVLVKVFGAKTELIVDRAAERITVVELGRQGFGPQARL